MKSVIAGIDPGTTAGYAFVSLAGKVLGVGSRRGISLDELISLSTDAGRVVVVGTDKAKCPGQVHQLSVKLGARLIVPDADMGVEEKKQLISDYKVANDHERDALASALFALKKIQPLLHKIERYLEKRGEQAKSEDVRQLMLLKDGISIADALRELEPAQEPLPEEPKPRIAKKKPGRLTRLRNENKMLREHSRNLEEHIERIEHENELLRKKLDRQVTDQQAKKILARREKKIIRMGKKSKAMKEKIDLYASWLLDSSVVVIKRFSTLRYDEYLKKKELVKEGDVLLVEDPSKYSQKTLCSLKQCIILHKGEVPKQLMQYGHVFLKAGPLDPVEEREFAIIGRRELEEYKKKSNALMRIVEEYKKSRKGGK